jgi:hypothetical protein
MRRAVFSSLLLATGLVLSAASGPSAAVGTERVVDGKGTLRFGHENNGRAMFEFIFDDTGTSPKGELLFAAEDHDALGMYPDIIVRSNEIEAVTIKGRRATIKAHGFFHDEPVFITITVVDGEGTTVPDRFSIVTVQQHKLDDGGHHGNLNIAANVWSGNIAIGNTN